MGDIVMPKSNFSSDNVSLFETIVKIVRKHDGNYYAMQDEVDTTRLIMKEIEKWQDGVSRLTPLCKELLFGREETRSGYGTKPETGRPKPRPRPYRKGGR